MKKTTLATLILFLCLFGLLVPSVRGVSQEAERRNLLLTEDDDFQAHDVYIYQRQAMNKVSWLYTGFVPRTEDGRRVRVNISKSGYTMRVTQMLTQEEVADYPAYLVRRGKKVEQLVRQNRVGFFQEWRYENYLIETSRIQKEFDTSFGYSKNKYQAGLKLLKEKFPANIFELSKSDTDAKSNGLAVMAVFVYPITVHAAGTGWPPDGTYIQREHYSSVSHAIQERRTDHGIRERIDTTGDGVPDKTVRRVVDYIFSGFPAFWLDASGKGTGVHGPIRYSELDQRGKSQSGPFGPGPEAMKRFWSENEFLGEPSHLELDEMSDVKYRWDLVRTNNSQGCFRAESLELRHLLPTSRLEIFNNVEWEVSSSLDLITIPGATEPRIVDVNYYVAHPYSFPLNRNEWVRERILGISQQKQNRSSLTEQEGINEQVQDIINGSIQFPYLDPNTLEYFGPSDDRSANGLQGEFNSAGKAEGQFSI